MTGQNQLAKVLGALSIAADQGAGNPQGIAMLAAVLAVRIGRKCGLTDDVLKQIYFSAVVSFIGCTSTSTEASDMGFGEESQLLYSISMCDWRNPIDLERSLKEHFKPDVSDELRNQTIEEICKNPDGVMFLAGIHCEQAMVLASRLPVPDGVVDVLKHMLNRWDGNFPGLSGTAIPLESRIIALAGSVELFRRAGGLPSAFEMLKQRSGGHFDPELCQLVQDEAQNFFADYAKASEWDLYLNEEPEPKSFVLTNQRVDLAQCFADYVDQKSGWLHGHSRQVASLALRTATELGLNQEDQQRVYIAGLLHDIGRIAVPNRVWEKADSLTPIERREAESHSYHTETIISLAGVFDDVIAIAESVHERLDSSGYHRRGQLESTAAACVATADIYDALTHPRPWRDALSIKAAAEHLIEEVSQGRLPSSTVQGLLRVSGQSGLTVKTVYPAGLTQREVDVLACLVRGMSNKQISSHLGISPKTAENHLTRVYEKTETMGRAQAAVYAMKHGIFAP